MGSLNWASGLILLGRLYLRPLQRFFHSLGLTDRFTPWRRSDPSVLASLLQQWQDLPFLTSGIPIRPFQVEFTIFTDTSTQGWGVHRGDSLISGTSAPLNHQLHINCLELKAIEAALHRWAPVLQGHQVMIATDNSAVVSYINKQGGTWSHTLLRLVVKLFTWLQAQNIVVRARHIPGCLNVIADHLSRPNQPISTEWSRNREPNLGDPSSGHVCNCFKLPPSSVHVSDSGATGTGGGCSVSRLAGEVDVHVSLLSKVIQKLQSTQEAEVILIAPWWPKQLWFPHLLRLCVDRPRSFLAIEIFCHNMIRNTVCTHGGSCATLQSSKLAAVPRRHSTNCMYDDQWLHFTRWAAGQGFNLLNPSAAQIASFIYSLFDTGLSPQTIKGYRTCLGSVLNHTGKARVVLHRTISDMIASMELQRPRVTPVLPQWDLGIVLEALSKSPYEPLREASLKHLTLKTVFYWPWHQQDPKGLVSRYILAPNS